MPVSDCETLSVEETDALLAEVVQVEVNAAVSVEADAVGSPSAPTAGCWKMGRNGSAGERFLIMRLSWAWSRGV